ncbi:hypothetical protein MMC34_006185 [Xylographa carneopallida]|nr:hypothetical protein [Xylographa carneopallida]
MPVRLPTTSDFSSHFNLTVTPPPQSQAPVNVLILLHGLGDTNRSFSNLGKQLALPETVCISLQGPTPLPFDLGGFHWGDDIIFDQATGQMELDTGFSKITRILTSVIEALVEKCGYQPREIILFGFGQGGMAALATAASFDAELGGIVSIGGPLPSSIVPGSASPSKSRTPVLILGGSSRTLITPDAISRLGAKFQYVDCKKWPDKVADGMPRNRDEMLPIMQFFSRRLRSRAGVPEGSVEIG